MNQPQRGPVFSQHPAHQVSGPYTPDLPPASTSAEPPSQPPVADNPEEEASGKKKRKPKKKGGYVCEICGKKETGSQI